MIALFKSSSYRWSILAVLLLALSAGVMLTDARAGAVARPESVTVPVVEEAYEGPREKTATEQALEKTITFEFENVHLQAVFDLIADQAELNIVADSRVIAPADATKRAADGTYVTDGIVPSANVANVSVAQALSAVLEPLGLAYSVQPDFVWVSSPVRVKTESFEELETRYYELQVERPLNAEKVVGLLRQSTPDVFDASGQVLSKMFLVAESNQLVVHNTPTNLAILENLLPYLDVGESAVAKVSIAPGTGAPADIVAKAFSVGPYREGGLFTARVSIRNEGGRTAPKFGVLFCYGQGGRSTTKTHSAGAIDAGAHWGEGTMPFALKEGESTVAVQLDPSDVVPESDETNNFAKLKVVVKDGKIVSQTAVEVEPSALGAQAAVTHTIPFEVTKSHFRDGDGIEIIELTGSDPRLKAGGRYLVKGRYRLGSEQSAKLHVYATGGETMSDQGPVVVKGEGTFTRTLTLISPGDLHLSFYPDPGGDGFGDLYFAPKS